jgi:hypothetical protein
MLHGDQILRNEDYRKEELRREGANNTCKLTKTGYRGISRYGWEVS